MIASGISDEPKDMTWHSSGEVTPEVLEVIWSAGQLVFPSKQEG